MFSHYLTHRLGFRATPNDLDPWRQNFSQTLNRAQGHFENGTGRWSHDIGVGYYQNDLANTHPTQNQITRNSSQAQIDWRQSYQITDQLRLQTATDYVHEELYWRKAPSLKQAFKAIHGGIGGILSYQPNGAFMVMGSTRIDKYQGSSPKTTYRLGSQYLFENVTVKGGVGTAFKAPTLQQKYYKDPFLSGNPHLKPERIFGWDFGIGRSFLQKRLELEVTFFQNHIRDLIAGSLKDKTLININQSRTQGVEGLVRFLITTEWTVEISHAYTQTWDKATKKDLIDTPRHKTTFGVQGQITPEWKVSADVLYIGSRDTHNAITWDRVTTPSYTLVGIQTAYQLSDQWEIYGRGENALNKIYQSPKNFQQPGIGLYIGLRVHM